MKLETLKLGWNKLPARYRTVAAAGAVAICLAIALSSGIGAADGEAQPPPSLGGPRIDLAETDRAYSVTIAAPESEQPRLNVRMEGRNLFVGSTSKSGGATLEQQLSLPEADAMKAPTFDRQAGKLVVTVPKRANASSPAPPIARAPQSSGDPDLDAWRNHVLGRFRQMQQQMDRMMGHAVAGFGNGNALAAWPDLGGLPAMSGLNIEDKGNEYVIHANIPGGPSDNVKVSVDNERVLKITASEENPGTNRYQMSNVTQVLTLPGPVQSDKIQVDQSQGSLVITLPKA